MSSPQTSDPHSGDSGSARYGNQPRGVPAPGYRPPDPPSQPPGEKYPPSQQPPPDEKYPPSGEEYPPPGEKYPPSGEKYPPSQPPPGEKYPPSQQPPSGYGPEDPQYPTPPEGYDPKKPPEPEPYKPTPDEPSTYKPADSKPPRRCPPSMSCDTSGIDKLKCENEGVKAEAAERAASAIPLENRHKAFEAARTAYRTERTAAKTSVDALTTRLKDLLDTIECKVRADRRPAIKSAFDEVLACIRECSETADDGVPEDCGFTGEQWTTDRIAGLRARVEKVEKHFDEKLATEPEALKGRVTAVTKLVDDLAKAKDVEPQDWERLYVQALEADWRLKTVYRPFDDANKYQDDLCRGLTCSLEGRGLLAKLVADKTFEDCQASARRTRCDDLRKNLVSETIAAVKQPSSVAEETSTGRP
ncbi:hypothetical protein AB0F72_17145 [Actinoplanes sp. NPDC023936]|uniref:hypothetical protein n=1 Tax=Actinoplanes sp. NPDC023936 TaxID=3154910 RepID=UPI0033C79DF9